MFIRNVALATALPCSGLMCFALGSPVAAQDVTNTLEASGCDQVHVLHKPHQLG
jgi:hypothetical protein